MDTNYTFAMIKSDALARGQMDAILEAVEASGLAVVDVRPWSLSRDDAARLYPESVGKDYHDRLMRSVTGPAGVIMLVLGGENAAARWRDTMGATDPEQAEPGTIRATFGTRLTDNAVHGSDTAAAARREVLLAQSLMNDASFGRGVVPCPPEFGPVTSFKNLNTVINFSIGEVRYAMSMREIVSRLRRLVDAPAAGYGFQHMEPTLFHSRRDPGYLDDFISRLEAGGGETLWMPTFLPDHHGRRHVFDYSTVGTEHGNLDHAVHSAIHRVLPECMVDTGSIPQRNIDIAACCFFARMLDANGPRLAAAARPRTIPGITAKARARSECSPSPG